VAQPRQHTRGQEYDKSDDDEQFQQFAKPFRIALWYPGGRELLHDNGHPADLFPQLRSDAGKGEKRMHNSAGIRSNGCGKYSSFGRKTQAESRNTSALFKRAAVDKIEAAWPRAGKSLAAGDGLGSNQMA